MKSLGNIARNNIKKGFTLVEVVVASVVFALAVTGVMATISSLSAPVEDSKEEVTAAFLGKKILDDWRKHVDASTWGDPTNILTNAIGAGWQTLSTNKIDNIDYTTLYSVTDPGNGSLQVTLNIVWTE